MTKENYEHNLVKRMKSGSYSPNPKRRAYIPEETKGKMRQLRMRSNRSCHQAVRGIIEMVQYRKTNHVAEADIRGFFDNVEHEWPIKMLSHDIVDRKFLEINENF